MKKSMVVFFLFFLLSACGGGSGNSNPSLSEHYAKKIIDWQAREKLAPPIHTTCYDTGYIEFDIMSTVNQVFPFTAVSEQPGTDYWQTSEESLARRAGDCEDMAILAYRALSDSCLKDKIDVRIRGLDEPGNIDHFVAIVYYGPFSFEIDNLVFKIGESETEIITEFDGKYIFF